MLSNIRDFNIFIIFQGDNVQTQVVDKLAFAFGDRKCAKWSKDWPNGGPDPNGPRGNVLWKDYRKQLVTRLDARVAEKAAKKASQESARKRREVNTRARRSLEMLESINEDVFDVYFNNAAKDGERSAGIELERMLSSDQKTRLYQILVSYMKWAFRYMAECPNDAAGTHAVKMYDFIENQLVELYDLIQQRIDEKNQ